ncbi:MAG: hypothetical protein U5K54_09280 [Cytophagales bacterium]|nr:hypothetical protein [Cytophagales bacterium]
MSLLLNNDKHKKLQGVRSFVSSQLTVHPVTNWLNYLKADLHLVKILEEQKKISKIDIRSSDSTQDKGIDALLWSLPVPKGEYCTNPCCRRIFAVYGPSYTHAQLNHETHIALREWFGIIATKSFDQLTTILRTGYAVDREERKTYLPNVKQIDIPFILLLVIKIRNFCPKHPHEPTNGCELTAITKLFQQESLCELCTHGFFHWKNCFSRYFSGYSEGTSKYG